MKFKEQELDSYTLLTIIISTIIIILLIIGGAFKAKRLL